MASLLLFPMWIYHPELHGMNAVIVPVNVSPPIRLIYILSHGYSVEMYMECDYKVGKETSCVTLTKVPPSMQKHRNAK